QNVAHAGSADPVDHAVKLWIHLDADRLVVQLDEEDALSDIFAGDQMENGFHWQKFVETGLECVDCAYGNDVASAHHSRVRRIVFRNGIRFEGYVIFRCGKHRLHSYPAAKFAVWKIQRERFKSDRKEALK